MTFDLLRMARCAHAEEVLECIRPDYSDLEITIYDVAEKPEPASRCMLMSAPGIVIDGELIFSGGVDEAKLRERLDAPASGTT